MFDDEEGQSMINEPTKKIRLGASCSRGARLGVAVLAASALLLAPMASGATSPLLKSAKVPGFSGALVNGSSRTLYVLSSEKGAKIKCKSACLATWPPLLVKTSVTTISLGAGVKGKIGFVTRSKSMKQVTFNSFPVYTYAGDTGTLQASGEGIQAFGGTWTLAKAKATSPSATAYAASGSSTTTTSGGYY
jgi:predicted lipoprotein with Yx(FWY)xxD motif